MGTKYALLTGCNQFKSLPRANWLRGCVNDVDLWKATLTSSFGFRSANIKTLTDKAATTLAVFQGIDDLSAKAVAGDVVVLGYSTHGTRARIKDGSGNLLPSENEAIVLYDFAWDNMYASCDLVFNSHLSHFRPGVHVYFIVDTCHSGTMDREVFESNGVGAYPKADIAYRFLQPPASIVRRSRGLKAATHTMKDAMMPEHVLMAACKETEKAAETAFGGKLQGAFTYWVTRKLVMWKNARLSAAFQQAQSAVRAGFRQTPQLLGSEDIMSQRPFTPEDQ